MIFKGNQMISKQNHQTSEETSLMLKGNTCISKANALISKGKSRSWKRCGDQLLDGRWGSPRTSGKNKKSENAKLKKRKI